MTEQELPDLVLTDRRNSDSAGNIRIQVKPKLSSIRAGGTGYTDILFFREEDARELYERLDKVFGDE